MKKRIALLLLLALALTLLLAACNQTQATKIIPRWDTDGETYEYKISLSDFADENSANYFNTHGDGTYFKDFVVRTGEPINSQDEVRPVAVNGTYTVMISHSDDNYDTLTTEQNLLVTYQNKDGNLIDQNVLAELNLKGLLVVNEGSTLVLKSYTKTTVEFRHDDKQAPRKSSTTVKGFYVGKVHQEVSDYEITTEYKYESKKTVAEIKLTTYKYQDNAIVEDTNEFSNDIKRYTEGTFIDGNQLFTYARSLDKSSTSFQDSPTVSVYNPFNQTLQSASFVFTAEAKAVLTNSEQEETLFIKLPTVGVIVGGMPFMLQESAPVLQQKLPTLFNEVGYGPDSAFYGPDPYAKHTPVRFRVGYISYELNYNVGTPSEQNELNSVTLWDALVAYVNSAE